MSLDLILMPNEGQLLPQFKTWHDSAILRIDRDGWGHRVRDKCTRILLPSHLEVKYDGEIWTECSNGTPLTYALAVALLKVKNKDNGKGTEAALAYLRAIDPKIPVLLLFF